MVQEYSYEHVAETNGHSPDDDVVGESSYQSSFKAFDTFSACTSDNQMIDLRRNEINIPVSELK